LRAQKSIWSSDLTLEQAVAPTQLRLFGCRALPRLIAALHPSEESGFLNAASYLICFEAWTLDHRNNDDPSEHLSARMAAWQILPQDSGEMRRRKIELMAVWWREHAPEHLWWRVWTDVCLRPTR